MGTEIKNNTESKVSLGLCILLYLASVGADICYLIKWIRYDFDAVFMFVLLLITHTVIFIIPAIIFFMKIKKNVSTSVISSILVLMILSGIGAFGVVQAHTMTAYIYKSRYGRYDKTHEQFLSGATMDVTSDSQTYGVWNEDITESAPELSFEPVEGASYYVIYMVDESSNNRMLWYVPHVDDTIVPAGTGEYTGPVLTEDEGEHNLTVYVYALQGKPGLGIDLELGDASLSGDLLYYDILNVIEGTSSPYMYGNVIAYGYVTGTYSMNLR